MPKKLLLFSSSVVFFTAALIAGSAVAHALDIAASSGVAATATSVISQVPAIGLSCPVFDRSLSMGVSGNDVAGLQTYLDAQGYLNVSPTGYFGNLTQNAVARWQAKAGIVLLGGSGSGIFGPRSRAYFLNSCGSTYNSSGSGGTTQDTLNFSALPSSGVAPLTVQFTETAPQGAMIGNAVNFGDGTGATLGFAPVCSSCNLLATGSHTYTATGTYIVTLTNGTCACPANGICNCPNSMILTTTTITVTGDSNPAISDIQELNSSGTVALSIGGIAEIRNGNFYFTLSSLTPSAATIDMTAVGCWNSFPSDPAPSVHCMIAVMPTPPQTLSVGQTYNFENYNIILTAITNDVATFSIQPAGGSQL